MPEFSIAIPTYEMKGMGAQYLQELFESINKQNVRDFEVCISDHSQNDDILDVLFTLCKLLYYSVFP